MSEFNSKVIEEETRHVAPAALQAEAERIAAAYLTPLPPKVEWVDPGDE